MSFTYEVPKDFEHRLIQYMSQSVKAPELAKAFDRCTLEYDDLGNAYYAGMKHTPWDSNALDISFLGPSECLKVLEKYSKTLQDSIKKALRTSETGLLLHKLFFLEDTSSKVSDFASDDERFNIDLETARCVMRDIVKAGERLSSNSLYSRDLLEDNINDCLRDALFLIGYSEAKDQTRHGLSASGLSSGEVDILLCKDGREVAVIEGLKLTSVDKSYIDKHIEKASINYNPLGTAVFVVAYVSTTDFGGFWERCFEYLRTRSYCLQVKSPIVSEPSPNAACRVASMVLSRDKYDFPLFFIAIRLIS